MSRKNKKDDGLDTETTIVDMNVEGFKWYNPTVKKQKQPSDQPKTVRHSVSRKEYWQRLTPLQAGRIFLSVKSFLS